jgi:DNA-binding transcriptional LysR family regulator
MNEILQKKQYDLHALPDLSFRQLEIFSTVCHEKSYANAAIELSTTRANVKRACEEFEKAVGRKLFEENDRQLQATEFAQGMLGRMGALSRGLRHLEDGVRSLHQEGRVLRFAAAGEFFRGGLFTDFLARLKINDAFRPCFLKIDPVRYKNALLNAECDVYFGVSLLPSDRMDLVDLGPVPWKIIGRVPSHAQDLRNASWAIAEAGEPGSAADLLEKFHRAGASGGKILPEGESFKGTLFQPDPTAAHNAALCEIFPCYRFTAVLRKHHPYADLKSRLNAACPP